MKIISKHKDYYDYLQGIYGIDETLVFDRTEYYPMPLLSCVDNVFTFYVCDYQIECLLKDGKFYYGPEIEQFLTKEDKEYEIYGSPEHYCLRTPSRLRILKQPKKLEFSPNEDFNCPILIETWDRTPYKIRHESKGGNLYFSKNPILKEYSFHKLFSAEQLWVMISEWLGKDRTKINEMTDKQKIVAYGFNEITSFRRI